MTVPLGSEVWRDFVSAGIPASGANQPQKAEIRAWAAWVEGIITAFTSNGGLVYSTKAAMDADLAHGANSMAWVVGDPVVANNGVYGKVGASGAGSWTRRADLPFSFIIASDAGAGTPNAIQATTSIPVSASALIWMNVFEANTASPVTVSFNGGSALTIKTNSGNDLVTGGLLPGMIVMGIVSGSTFRLVSDQASAALLAAAEAAQAAAEAAASSIATYATREFATTQNLSGITDVTISRWSSTSFYAPATYKKVAEEPSHPAKFQSADGAWWEISSETLRLRMFGAIGDYDPETETGTDDTEAIQAAFATAAALGRTLRMGRGVFYHEGEINYPAGLHLIGVHRNTSQLFPNIDNTMGGGRIEAQDVTIEYVGTVVRMTGTLGPDDGEYGSGLTLARYYTDGEPIDTRGILLRGVGYYKAPLSPNNVAHGISGIGRFAELQTDGVEVADFSGAAIQCHWGANAVGVDLPIVDTYHPNKININNLIARNCGRLYTFSSCYDLVAKSLRGINCNRLGDIIPGDEINFYANDDDKPLVGGSIHISDVVCDGIDDTVTGALRVVSIGTSRADDDVETGLGTRRVLFWKNVLIENVLMVGANNVPRAIDLTGACGNITLRNINAKNVAKGLIGVRLADNRGNIILDNVAVGSQQGVEWQRAWDVACVNMDIDWHDPTAYSGDTFGVFVDGTEFTTTLAAAKAAGATSISLTSALGAVLNPGDTLIVNGNHVKVSGARQIRSTELVIPIEAMPWTATAGQTIYCDQRSVPKMRDSKVKNYHFGVALSDCKGVGVIDNELIDISKQGITGVAKSGFIGRNKFVRGGQHRLVDAVYATRNIILSAGCENVTVRDNEFGIDADYIDICLQTSSDTGNIRAKDNAFGSAITAHISLATQSNARLDASQFNEYSGNYRTDGGQLTGPSTWYEILQNAIVRYHGTAAPTRGFHRAGSEWAHTAPAVGSPIGGMCTASGTPGTWVNKANL